jgi:hypothetical protein
LAVLEQLGLKVQLALKDQLEQQAYKVQLE